MPTRLSSFRTMIWRWYNAKRTTCASSSPLSITISCFSRLLPRLPAGVSGILAFCFLKFSSPFAYTVFIRLFSRSCILKIPAGMNRWDFLYTCRLLSGYPVGYLRMDLSSVIYDLHMRSPLFSPSKNTSWTVLTAIATSDSVVTIPICRYFSSNARFDTSVRCWAPLLVTCALIPLTTVVLRRSLQVRSQHMHRSHVRSYKTQNDGRQLHDIPVFPSTGHYGRVSPYKDFNVLEYSFRLSSVMEKRSP